MRLIVSRAVCLSKPDCGKITHARFVLFAYRLGRHGKVFLTIPSQSSTDEQKFIQKGEAPGTDSMFDLDPKDIVFSVGGVPPNVTVMLYTNIH